MKNFYEPSTVKEVERRLEQLSPECPRQWGKMNPAQAMAHCAIAMEWAVGDSFPPRMFIGRILAPLIRGRVVGDDEPMRRNSATSPVLVITDERDLSSERERLRGLIDRFCAAGPGGCTTHPHTFFGALTPDQWAILTYKHVDHHLRQFGV